MDLELIVVKHGGWSVGTSETTSGSAKFVLRDKRRRVVVVSGPKGLTDLYIHAAEQRILKESVEVETYGKISGKWEELCYGLGLQENHRTINGEFDKILKTYDGPRNLDDIKAKRFIDNVARLGETFEADYVFAPYLNLRGCKAVSLSPAGLIYGTDEPGNASIVPDPEMKFKNKVHELLGSYDIVVVHGFYCSTKEGNHIVTLPRNSSDTSGSHAAAELDAILYENCTNNSIRRASPDAVADAKTLDVLTYREALELAYMGFGIFKDSAVVPCMRKLIPIHVVNMMGNGDVTKILAERQLDQYEVAGIAYKPGFLSLNIEQVLRSRQEHSSLSNLALHTEQGITSGGEFPIEQIMTSVSNTSFLIHGEQVNDEKIHMLKRHLMEYFVLREDEITIRYDISLIALVGQYMKDRAGLNYRAAGALAAADISTSHIVQGGSEISILYGVQETSKDTIKARACVRAIYNEFFVDPVFGKFLEEQRKVRNSNH